MHLAARRAREINAYYHSLGEGLGQYVRPLVDQVDSNKPLSIALEEIAADKIVPQYGDARADAERFLGSPLGDDADVVPFAVGSPDGDADVTDAAMEAPDTAGVDDEVTDVDDEAPAADAADAAEADLGVDARAEDDVATGDEQS